MGVSRSQPCGAEKEPLPPSAEPSAAKGPIRILCDEIGFPFDPRLERTDVLVAFVRALVGELETQRELDGRIARLTGKPPSEGSAKVLALTKDMLTYAIEPDLLVAATKVHDASDELNPDDAYPTDHLIDMLSSCASAIRFGLETPCRSRHAASAANHVWRQLYGVSRFDSRTPTWEKDFARQALQAAIISLLRPAPLSLAAQDTSARSDLAREDG